MPEFLTFGELLIAGGTFALYSLLCRNMDIGFLSSKRIVPNSRISHANVYQSSQKPSRLGKFIERSVIARKVLLFIAMLGICMLIGDGILTPAISGLLPFAVLTISAAISSVELSITCVTKLVSVLSAMDGIRGPFPSVSKCKIGMNFYKSETSRNLRRVPNM